MYFDSLRFMVGQWGSDDYSHGFFVPIISAFLIWQRRSALAAIPMQASWWGPFVLVAGLLLYVIGDYATLYFVLHVSLWLVIVGLVLSFIGLNRTKEIAFPLLFLLAAIPLPVFLYGSLSSRLQLLSSTLGVGCLQLVGVTAFREGNVIDLGPVQLQVVEACSGIRYLFPLTALALLCAYGFRDRMWKRVVLVLSAVPISVFVNGFRIGIVGILVELYGSQAAEGFFHLFEGWVLFMASLGLLVLEMWILARLNPAEGSAKLLERFTWRVKTARSAPSSSPAPTSPATRVMPGATLCSVAVLVPFAMLSWAIGERVESPPSRPAFMDFSMRIGDWQGTPLAMESQYLAALKLDDYVLADYAAAGASVNLYVAYYRSQKKGQSAHSPQSCIPGGGWEIVSHRNIGLPLGDREGTVHPANRVLIQKGHEKQLVLYWFKQRERYLSNEYLVKFYLFWDALTKGRSDGALIRLGSALAPGESEEAVERRLTELARAIQPDLARYVPD
jgi:exosortase D (VPLPA-CTERM-specific)